MIVINRPSVHSDVNLSRIKERIWVPVVTWVKELFAQVSDIFLLLLRRFYKVYYSFQVSVGETYTRYCLLTYGSCKILNGCWFLSILDILKFSLAPPVHVQPAIPHRILPASATASAASIHSDARFASRIHWKRASVVRPVLRCRNCSWIINSNPHCVFYVWGALWQGDYCPRGGDTKTIVHCKISGQKCWNTWSLISIICLKFGMCLRRLSAETLVKFQADMMNFFRDMAYLSFGIFPVITGVGQKKLLPITSIYLIILYDVIFAFCGAAFAV